MNPQFDHKFLEQYLNNKMSPVERVAFEARLAGDNVLKAELEMMKRSRGEKTALADQVGGESTNRPVEAKPSPSVNKPKVNLIPWIVLLLIIYVGLLYWTVNY